MVRRKRMESGRKRSEELEENGKRTAGKDVCENGKGKVRTVRKRDEELGVEGIRTGKEIIG